MIIKQVSMDELLREDKKEVLPPLVGNRIFKIPDDVWENRCQICSFKMADKNIPCDMRMIEKPMYEKLLPCRILRLARFDGHGECESFFIKDDTPGFCCSCKYSNSFCDGYCEKKNHAPELQKIMKGWAYGEKKDYWGKHRLSVCDDYKPKI